MNPSDPAAGPAFRLNVPMVAVLITVALQAVATISWAAKMDSRVAALEARPDTSATVGVLDERTKTIAKDVDRVVRLLDARAAAEQVSRD